MKNLFVVATVILMASCAQKKNTNAITITSEDGKENVTVNTEAIQKAAENMQGISSELNALTPLNAEELRKLIPTQIMGVTATNVDVANAMGASIASAEYQINDSTDINLNIIDCAGPGGAGIYSMQYLAMANVTQDNDEEYTKTIDFNGAKAFEQCKKDGSSCTLTYFAGNRFLITLSGDHVNIDGLKQVAKGINVK